MRARRRGPIRGRVAVAKSPIPSASLLDLSKQGYVEFAGVLAQHEAGHAVAALYLGMGVEYATIALDALDGGGRVHLDGRTKPGVGHLWVILAGPIATGDPIAWRPLEVKHDDEGNAAALVAHLGLDEDGWNEANDVARQILSHPHVERAWRAISAALYDSGTLDRLELKRIFDEAA